MSSYTLLGMMLVVVCLFFAVGLLGRLGSGADGEKVTPNAAASLALLTLLAIILFSFQPGALSEIFGAMCSSLPLVGGIADYGSFRALLHQDPGEALVVFFDTVLLTAVIDLFAEMAGIRVYLTRRGKELFMPILLTSLCIGIAALLLLNFIRSTASYQWVVSTIGLLTSATSLASVVSLLLAVFLQDRRWGGAVVLGVLAFSRSRIGAALRSALFQSLVFLGAIYLLEGQFGSLSAAMAQISTVMVAFIPVVILVLGLVYMLSAIRR